MLSECDLLESMDESEPLQHGKTHTAHNRMVLSFKHWELQIKY